MAIRNYTSKRSPAQSAGEIQRLLSEHDAHRVSLSYEAGDAVAIEFQMMVHGRPAWFRIEPDPAGMLEAMKDDDGVPRSKCTIEQAARTAWKNELEWLDVQFSKIAAKQARLEQLLLGYAVTETGETVWERIERGDNLLGGDSAAALPAHDE